MMLTLDALTLASARELLKAFGDGAWLRSLCGGRSPPRGKLVPRAMGAVENARRDRPAQADIDRAVVTAKSCHAELIQHARRDVEPLSR